MIFTCHSSFYHSCSYHICDLNLLLDFRYFLFVIDLALTLSNFIEKKGMVEQALLFHAFLIYEGITRKQQTKNSFIKILEGKEILRKNN